MKRTIVIFLAMILSTIMFSCSSTKNTEAGKEVGKSVSLDADIASMKTYKWVDNLDRIPEDRLFIVPGGVLVFNNESGRKKIKEAIQYELDSRGYKLVDNNPDMLVLFAVTEMPGSLRTTNGYVTLSSGEKVRTEDNITYTDVKPGTLIINLLNGDNQNQIWQGFASGILNDSSVQDEATVRQAVSEVFSEFKFKNTM
jgi:hypothetical protein